MPLAFGSDAPVTPLGPWEAVLAAADAGELLLSVTDIVVNCPITRPAEGPALRGAREEDPVLTDGFSCAMQVDHLEPQRPGMHLAQLLDPAPPSGPQT